MRKIFCIVLLLLTVSICFVPLSAKDKKKAPRPVQKVYLSCNALTSSYTYTALRGEIAGVLTGADCMLVYDAKEADWTVQVVGTTGTKQETEFGAQTFYSTEVNLSLMIDKGAFDQRVFETTITETGKHTSGYDEAAVEAYKRLKPQVCELIKQQITSNGSAAKNQTTTNHLKQPPTTSIKKVAILEAVDKTDKVEYVHKLMLRTNLTKAITAAEGYEGYDRTDLESLMGEQNFQRTGMVSTDQIKQLGEMTGAQYVLVAEVAMVDSSNMFATAKIIDVETAHTIKTETQLMRTTAQDIQNGCTLLASNLLGVKLNVGITQSAANTPSAKPASKPVAKPQTNSNNSKQAQTANTQVTWTWPEDVTAKVKRCYARGGNVYVEIVFTNNTEQAFKYNAQAVRINIYDADGKTYKPSGLYCVGTGATGRTWVAGTIPSGVSVTIELTVPDVPKNLSAFTLLDMEMINFGRSSAPHLKIKNLHIDK